MIVHRYSPLVTRGTIHMKTAVLFFFENHLYLAVSITTYYNTLLPWRSNRLLSWLCICRLLLFLAHYVQTNTIELVWNFLWVTSHNIYDIKQLIDCV